jgi:uncharacterized 2Fe-2S/4Fe-4S cluster protein (DUF4445 family)
LSIDLTVNDRRMRAESGLTLFECAEELGVRVPTSCTKQGKCRECLVEITAGMERLSQKTREESHLPDNFRLSCRSTIIADSGSIICQTMRRGNLVIEKKALNLRAAQKPHINPAIKKNGKRIFRDGQEIDRNTGRIYGLAMDLGTTTVVLRLIDLETGEIIADSSFENPQRFGGSDVMARIRYDTENKGKLLQRTLAGYLTHAIEEFPIDPASVYELVIAGNSTMRDMFFRKSVYPIGQSPYRSLTEIEMAEGKRTTTSLSQTAKSVLLPVIPKSRVYGLPIISGHVGADAAACMLAVDIASETRTIAIMDIGTNTELILGNKHRIMAASCPAGPAFEGGKISHGMPALPGAIDKIRLTDDGAADIRVIGGGTPTGICGSGLIDLLSELLKKGEINHLGRFVSNADRFIVSETNGIRVFLTENDISELAQAKGANVAGIYTIFADYGMGFDEIDVFYLAGGFGRYIDIGSAKRIGLIPDIPDEKIIQIGNAAIEGASIALLSIDKRRELEAMVKGVVHCRLETNPSFFEYFVEGCQFKPVGTATGSTYG